MNTLCLNANDPQTATIAAQLLREGQLVALPTETVYGLGADGLNPQAVSEIFRAKGRPQDNPLILHVQGWEDVLSICIDVPKYAKLLADTFWPGPLTMVLPAADCVPSETTAGLSTVAVRCPDSEITRKIIDMAGKPIAAPSANRSGKPSTTSAAHVIADMEGKIAAVVDGGPCSVGVESTIVDLSCTPPRLLRPGGISAAQLRAVLGELEVDKAVRESLSQGEIARAPGMKYRHYAPDAPVVIVDGSVEQVQNYLQAHYQIGDVVLCFDDEVKSFAQYAPCGYGTKNDPQSLARGLFSALRDLDGQGHRKIYARCPKGDGLAFAVANRLKKAAGFTVINLASET